MTTTAYPPSVGGVQAHVAELRARLERFEADVVTLWLQHRTDWLRGSTIALDGTVTTEVEPGLTKLGWDQATRQRMLPWVLSYYANPALAARRIAQAMAPYVEQVVGSDHVLIHNHRIGREFLARASLMVARKRAIPFVLTPHHHPRWRGYRYQGWIDVYREADAVLVLTNAEREEMRRLGVKPERIHVTWSAADPPLPADANRFRGLLGGTLDPIVLFVGQLYRYKGVAELVEATEAVRAKGVPVALVFIGPSTDFSKRFFARRKRPWLHVLGVVDDQTKWDALEAAEVVALPSQHEAFGRVFLEAWSKGKPVIGPRIPAVTDVITGGKNGLLVDPASPGELARALQHVLTDQQFAAALGAAGRQEVAERFSWDAVVDRVEAVYGQLLRP
ncbi:MAG TPA: glycosyltransferase family 4 protein [Candidatus Dormibacteraeota bacterium]|nr:glycosyltransferase family 4 protein [Candidatus Dormibacteraeota bacterium]